MKPQEFTPRFVPFQLEHPRLHQLYGALNQIGALLLIVILSPLMAFIAWRIWQFDHGPVIFRHYRVGQHGRLFRCLKFRSMVSNADEVLSRLLTSDPSARDEWARDQKLRRDPRVTPIGRFLRITSLDELPQLINVLRGDMHLVGPRPIVVQELARYGAAKRMYLAVKPGMTGLWQVSGRSNVSYARRVELDRRYVENHSFLLDLSILLRTARVLRSREGAL
jgi:undecaprenyl-phosphate galactose phosphotransferase